MSDKEKSVDKKKKERLTNIILIGALVVAVATMAVVFFVIGKNVSSTETNASSSESNVIVSGDFQFKYSEGLFSVCGYTGSSDTITLPEKANGITVQSVFASAFYSKSFLVNVTVPDGYTFIGERAFASCSNLKNVVIADSVTEIGSGAFYGCTSLSNIKLPDSELYIYSNVFDGCKSLTEITFPEKLKKIGKSCFKESGILSNANYWENGYCFVGNNLIASEPEKVTGDVKIKNGTRLVAEFTFCENEQITSVYFPDSVEIIGKAAIAKCPKLTKVTLPPNLKVVEYSLVYGDSTLTELVLPENVTQIDRLAFSKCPALAKVIIPKSVEKIDPDAFKENKSTVIFGVEGSYAQKYATENNIKFQVN